LLRTPGASQFEKVTTTCIEITKGPFVPPVFSFTDAISIIAGYFNIHYQHDSAHDILVDIPCLNPEDRLMNLETIFTMESSSIKYGPGSTGEVGYEMKKLGGRRIMLVIDPNLADSDTASIARQSLQSEGLDVVLYDKVRVEPTDASFQQAIVFAQNESFDGYVSIGGGSTIDTTKAANLYSAWPADFLDYVNPPIGLGQPVPGPLKPHIAIPTTAGTGSETTGIAIFDLLAIHAKTGIAHRSLRPNLGIIDPNNTRTLPPLAVASCGLDILTHALESLTALPYNKRPASESLDLRPAYQGANPISDVWSLRAVEMVSQNLVRVMNNPDDDDARGQLLLAATFAGIGFGNAGVTLPHGMSYPVAGMVRDYMPEGYNVDHPMVPHGISVVLNAPAVFRFTGPSNPELHLKAAQHMGVDISGASLEDAGDILADAVVDVMKSSGMPNGLNAVGYTVDDVDQLVAGALPQHRVIKLSPREVGAEELKQLFLDSMTCW
jgi:hydroxyacid-oxoacid transhydrogenase